MSLRPPVRPHPFFYTSTGAETRITNLAFAGARALLDSRAGELRNSLTDCRDRISPARERHRRTDLKLSILPCDFAPDVRSPTGVTGAGRGRPSLVRPAAP